MMSDNTHAAHAMGVNKNFWRDRLKHEFGFDVWQLPVCERCEGYALWGKDAVGICKCGTITKNPITVEQYYEQGHHVDRTVHSDTPLIMDRKIILAR
jgi:hypothetical protein